MAVQSVGDDGELRVHRLPLRHLEINFVGGDASEHPEIIHHFDFPSRKGGHPCPKMPSSHVLQCQPLIGELTEVHIGHLVVIDSAIFQCVHQGFRCGDVDGLKDGEGLNPFGSINSTVLKNRFHGSTGGGREGRHARQIRFETRLFQRFHSKAMHPVGLGFKVRPFLEVHGHVERLAGEQIQAKAHVFVFPNFSADVHGQGVNEIVHDTTKVHEVSEEERKRFNAFFFPKGGEFEPF